MIRVILADDHPVFLDGLRLLLDTTDGVTVVGTAANGERLLEVADAIDFDVAVLDLDMPLLDGAATCERLLARRPDAAALILTMHDDELSLSRALRSGACGYVLKGAGHGSIVRAIYGAAEGDTIFSGQAGRLVRETLQHPLAAGRQGLTEREYELLVKITTGADNRAIGQAMFLSTKTVQNNVSGLMAKLHATSRAHLVALARDRGIGHPPQT
ncbi:response regulator transcription factor [Glaciibacter superstes]|uniref:response regulator transcription factor n=1 Tax=Glaciibacter superstes TaxID=501023 RepID=UPI0003B358D3|nr:response regulator transcription factor [Glaciibacter superstes]